MATKSHLPISAHVRLNQLRRLKQLREQTDGLTAQQRSLADRVFGGASLDVLRRQAIEELVASGYLDEEIKMTLADPESPYSILIEGLKPEAIPDTLRSVIRKIRTAKKTRSAEQARDEYVQTQRRLIDATWVTLDEAGAAHHKSLLEFIDERSRAAAEAEGIVFTRAGRSSTKRPEPEEQPEEEEDAPVGDDDSKPNWEEEFTPDETDD